MARKFTKSEVKTYIIDYLEDCIDDVHGTADPSHLTLRGGATPPGVCLVFEELLESMDMAYLHDFAFEDMLDIAILRMGWNTNTCYPIPVTQEEVDEYLGLVPPFDPSGGAYETINLWDAETKYSCLRYELLEELIEVLKEV